MISPDSKYEDPVQCLIDYISLGKIAEAEKRSLKTLQILDWSFTRK